MKTLELKTILERLHMNVKNQINIIHLEIDPPRPSLSAVMSQSILSISNCHRKGSVLHALLEKLHISNVRKHWKNSCVQCTKPESSYNYCIGLKVPTKRQGSLPTPSPLWHKGPLQFNIEFLQCMDAGHRQRKTVMWISYYPDPDLFSKGGTSNLDKINNIFHQT